ncbi:hypothetical protein MKX79_13225 [Viridibacillus sp. FSL R5-0468]|uniref:hypothetical protein n=1 Tax=Viridibacillus sp. FSL R5-0468 TaxID=2921640 RepID=UPI0030FC8B4F
MVTSKSKKRELAEKYLNDFYYLEAIHTYAKKHDDYALMDKAKEFANDKIDFFKKN